MRSNWTSYSESPFVRRERSYTFVALLACAICATTSAAVILSLADFPVTRTGIPAVSPRPIVRNVGTFEPTKAPDHRPIESSLPSAMTSIGSGRDEPVTQADVEHQSEPHDQQAQKDHPQRSRGSHSPARFTHGFWRSPRFSSRRDELTSGAR